MSEIKGMVLAAGFGTRLRPITVDFPKPLVPIFGLNPLGLAIGQLQAAGIEEIAVNTHYQAEAIAAFLKERLAQPIYVSYEQEILGTGGVYNPVRSWLGDSHLAVINGDVVSSIEIKPVIEQHLSSGAIATMALLPSVIPGESGVHHTNGTICGIGKYGKSGEKTGNFACMQILSPQFFEHLPSSGSFDVISTGYKAILEQNIRLNAYEFHGIWHDIRSPEFYFAALSDLANKWTVPEMFGFKRSLAKWGVLFDRTRSGSSANEPMIVRGAKIGAGVTFGPEVFIESEATIGRGVSLERVAVLPGGDVPDGAVVKNKIIGKSFSIDLA